MIKLKHTEIKNKELTFHIETFVDEKFGSDEVKVQVNEIGEFEVEKAENADYILKNYPGIVDADGKSHYAPKAPTPEKARKFDRPKAVDMAVLEGKVSEYKQKAEGLKVELLNKNNECEALKKRVEELESDSDETIVKENGELKEKVTDLEKQVAEFKDGVVGKKYEAAMTLLNDINDNTYNKDVILEKIENFILEQNS